MLLARWLCLNPSLLLLDEPTRGIDVGAKAEIQGLIDELADNGLGVLMISSELEEITEGADRVVVLREGRTVAEFDHDEVNQDTVMHAMAHGKDETARRRRRRRDGQTARRSDFRKGERLDSRNGVSSLMCRTKPVSQSAGQTVSRPFSPSRLPTSWLPASSVPTAHLSRLRLWSSSTSSSPRIS